MTDIKGKNNPNWNGGVSIKLNNRMLKKIRDEGECKVCSSYEKLIIHHLDGNKENNKGKNWVVLCNVCHNNIHQRGYNFRKKRWSINVSEYFTSIQGELDTMGVPSHFLRLFGCNLDCKWCDSKYARLGKDYKQFSYNEIISLLKKWNKTHIKRIVISGGEPLYQNIVPLLLLCKIFGFVVEIETNGTLPPVGKNKESLKNRIYHKSLVEKFNISPKLIGTQNKPKNKKYYRTLETPSFKQFLDFKYNFKFVVDNEKDIFQIKKFQKKLKIPNERIWLMAEGQTREKQLNLMPKVFEWCVKYGFTYSPRLHVLAFNVKRGV